MVDVKPKNSFGGYRKRTISAREFMGSLFAFIPDAYTMYEIWGRHDIDPGFREELRPLEAPP